jgi:tRNA pseudouridine55 synthase
MMSLRGEQEQIPPMYSAKKVAGRKLYELARRGEEIVRQPVSIFVREFIWLLQEDGSLFVRNSDGMCDVRARVICSAGTYVRVLAEDLGARLGTPAHLAALRRTRAGAFALKDSLTLDELQSLVESEDHETLRRKIVSPAAALPEMLSVHLKDEQVARVRHGAPVDSGSFDSACDEAHMQMLAPDGELIAIGRYESETRSIRPRTLLITS